MRKMLLRFSMIKEIWYSGRDFHKILKNKTKGTNSQMISIRNETKNMSKLLINSISF